MKITIANDDGTVIAEYPEITRADLDSASAMWALVNWIERTLRKAWAA